MGLFLKEELFGEYLVQQHPEIRFEQGRSLLSINVVKTNPIMSCLYVGQSGFFAAKYNQQLGVFTDALFLANEDINELYLETKLTGDVLIVVAKELLSDGTPLTLRMNLPKFTAIKWHHQNLAKLKNEIEVKK